MPSPVASTSAGQPESAYALAIIVSCSRSVTRVALPSTATSAPATDVASEQRGSRVMLRHFFVPVPVWNQNVPSRQSAPTGTRCGLPSLLIVVSHVLREFTASAAGPFHASSVAVMSVHSTGGSWSAAPRLTMSMALSFSVLDETRRADDIHLKSLGKDL